MARSRCRRKSARVAGRLRAPVVVFLLVTLAIVGGIWWFTSGEDEPSLSSTVTSVTAPVKSTSKGDPESKSGSDADTAKPKSGHALDPVLELARKGLAKMDTEVLDYTSTLLKRERIAGSLTSENVMELKVKQPRKVDDQTTTPMMVYLKFKKPSSSAGREVIWVEGRNENQLVAHEGGFKNFMRMNLAPDGTIAMLGNRYPITGIGLARLLEKLIEKGERDREVGPCEVTTLENQEVAGQKCTLIQVTHPEKDPKYDFHIAQIFFDNERLVPLRYAAFSWPKKPGDEPVLEEEYTYTDLKINVGLTDEDFDPNNKAYQFPK